MIDNVVYEISVPECVKIGYLQKNFWPHTQLPSVCPTTFKNPGYATVVLCTQNEKLAPLHLCVVVSLCVYTVGFILWPLQKRMVCSVVVRVVLPWSWLNSLGLEAPQGQKIKSWSWS